MAIRSQSIPKNLKIAIVGGGPSGIYTAKYLVQNKVISNLYHPKSESKSLQIDIIEKLPVPHGLVRYGIAPDHQNMKLVTNTFSEFLDDSDCVSFYGNRELGNHFTIDDLKKHYHSVVLAYGASRSNRLDIPGSSLGGVYSAREFVQWYNEYPESHQFRHPQFNLNNIHEVGIIGNGNVALDLARILLFDFGNIAEYSQTDISHRAYSHLRSSPIRHVHILARKGPHEVAFTLKELRNLFSYFQNSHVLHPKIVYYNPDRKSLEELVDKASLEEIYSNRAKQRLWQFMVENIQPTSFADLEDPLAPFVCFHFGAHPVRYMPEHGNSNILGKYVFEQGGIHQMINVQMMFESIGYRAVDLVENVEKGKQQSTIKHLSHTAGRVSGYPSLYTAGWLKRGPVGILNTNIPCSKETVESIVADVQSGIVNDIPDDQSPPGMFLMNTPGVSGGFGSLDSAELINYSQSKRILEWEEICGRLELPHKVRSKFTTLDQAISVANDDFDLGNVIPNP